MADYGGMVRQPDILCLVAVVLVSGGGALAVAGRAAALVHDKCTLDVDLDGARVRDCRAYLCRVRRRPGPASRRQHRARSGG